MEAYGWRERLWRCTEERCVAWMHRGLEWRQRHQSAIVTANIIISKGPQHKYTTWPAGLLQFKLDDLVYAIRCLAMNYSIACPNAPRYGVILAMITPLTRPKLQLLRFSIPGHRDDTFAKGKTLTGQCITIIAAHCRVPDGVILRPTEL
jgi:hypothetical protein